MNETNETQEQSGGSRPEIDEQGVDLIEWLVVLAKYKALVLGLPFIAAVVAGLLSFLMPNIYKATARLMPPQQNQSAAASLLGQLGSLSGIAPGSLGVKNPADVYVGMLKSRSVADGAIEKS